MNNTSRFAAMIQGWLPVGVMYSIGSLRADHGRIIPETVIDHALPFTPAAFWGYLSFFVFIPIAYFFVDQSRLHHLIRSMQICALIAGLCFIAFPSTLAYPDMNGTGYTLNLIRYFHQFDSLGNCLPSLHGALTMLCMFALNTNAKSWQKVGIYVWSITILLSVLLLKRHLLIDLIAGVMMGYAVWHGLFYMMQTRTNRGGGC